MATKKKSTEGRKVIKFKGTPVVVTGYAFDDQEIDALIDLTFRMLERMMLDPRVALLIRMGFAARA